MADDGWAVVVGFTNGDWDGVNAGQMDFAAFRLDADGTEIWRYQVRLCRWFSASFGGAGVQISSSFEAIGELITHVIAARKFGNRAQRERILGDRARSCWTPRVSHHQTRRFWMGSVRVGNNGRARLAVTIKANVPTMYATCSGRS